MLIQLLAPVFDPEDKEKAIEAGDLLAKEAMRIKPGLPVIICTGYSERIDEERAKRMGISGFVLKPMVTKDMARMIREVLEGDG